jgi:hypothetical protein
LEQPFVLSLELAGVFGRDEGILMTNITSFLAATAAIGSLAAPAAAQYYPQQPTYPQQQYQQQYPQQPYQQAYPQNGYAYGQQGYSQNPIEQIINGLLGNRYNVTDRQAVSRCASAAVTQAQAQYGNGYGNRYGQGYGQGYGQQNGYGYNTAAAMRVTAITDVQRRGNGLRVSGTLASGAGYGNGYQGQAYNQAYAANSLSFRCNVANNGAVTGVRIGRNNGYRG